MKILLIGADDFIGKNVVEKFGKKHEVIGFDGDLSTADAVVQAMKGSGYECVIDGGGDEDRLVRFKNLQYACALCGAKKLLEITCHYPKPGAVAAREDEFENTLPKPQDTAEYVIARLAESDEKITLLRLFSPYGKYCDVGQSKVMEIMARGVTGKKTAVMDRDIEFSAVSVDDVLTVIAAYLDGATCKRRVQRCFG